MATDSNGIRRGRLPARAASILASAFMVGLLAGCESLQLQAEAPVGFAPFERASPDERFRAVSPDGVSFRVSFTANEPVQTSAFWRDAVRNQLLAEGYELLDEGIFAGQEGDGFWLVWLAPVGSADYLYLTGLEVIGEHIVVVESAGEYQRFGSYRDEIIAALDAVRLE